MYKRIEIGNGQIEIQEHFRSPMVYLDHWVNTKATILGEKGQLMDKGFPREG